MRYWFAVRLNRLPHQLPSFHQSLLSGFSPVGVVVAVVPKDKSRYPVVTGVCARAATGTSSATSARTNAIGATKKCRSSGRSMHVVCLDMNVCSQKRGAGGTARPLFD